MTGEPAHTTSKERIVPYLTRADPGRGGQCPLQNLFIVLLMNIARHFRHNLNIFQFITMCNIINPTTECVTV